MIRKTNTFSRYFGIYARGLLVMFPEGGIVRDQPLRSLKTGLARAFLSGGTKTGITVLMKR
ncbi:MAG TPA: hypothetical protein V6D35_00065 [Candidatus Sericytochromatia bacterium]